MAIEIYRKIAKEHSNWLEWEPETVLHTLDLDFETSKADKILAIQTVAKNPEKVTKNPFVFEKVVVALNNGNPIMGGYNKPHIEEINYAVQQIRKIVAEAHDLDIEKVDFGQEVDKYIAAVAKDRDWYVLPDPLQFAQENLNDLRSLKKNSEVLQKYSEINDKVKEDPKAYLDSESREVLRYVGVYLYDPEIL